ncbi:MAG: NAD(P)H-dependent oxidoreductase [Spirochaetes bacterium]|nr:NAD(P)H-dependent oxidoreductase [Spirochaetota bacterium]
MLILGLNGSPRKNGNTSILLSEFMEEAEKLGAVTRTIIADKKNILPCKEYKTCESKGFCPIDDDMENEIYSLLWDADLIVIATPVFFYSVPAQLKALIDRSQTMWARKYRLKLEDPGRKWRSGFLLALGATKGANLFEGLNLTVKYFFDAVGANFKESLAYRRIEEKGDIAKHPTAFKDAREKAHDLIGPYLNRKRVLFVCRGNACRSQMSQAFAQFYAGDRIEAQSAGDSPAESVSHVMMQAMAEKGIDLAFRKPRSVQEVVKSNAPHIIVTMGCEVSCPVIPGAKVINWDLPDPVGKPVEFMRELRDDIKKKVIELVSKL